MSAEAPSPSTPEATAEPHHFRRILTIWIAVSVVGDLLFAIFVGPHVPPGRMSDTATSDSVDFTILFLVALPVLVGVWVYMGYAIVMWRASRPGVPEPVGGPRARGNLRVQIAWIASTTVVVLALFVFGTVELYVTNGSGGGEGPNPIWTPTSATILPVQVIAQQWRFTFRYPTFGGFETPDLILPVNTTVEFHVTSLDVIHDFWAYQIGVKADANPGSDNIAYTTTKQLGTFTVRCDELCGLWHGAMYDFGRVVSKSSFEQWAARTEIQLAALTKTLPPFALTYTPDANGADGGFYPDTNDPYSNVETYGATQPSS
ncbi:MAG: cytochrome c oxidase subunit II [Acidimicrobiales bacterium]|jgi:cytochrome c oxidase subunit 2